MRKHGPVDVPIQMNGNVHDVERAAERYLETADAQCELYAALRAAFPNDVRKRAKVEYRLLKVTLNGSLASATLVVRSEGEAEKEVVQAFVKEQGRWFLKQ